MTSSPIRPTSRTARRTRLLAASALCGVATMLAQPTLAQTLPGIPGAGSITVSTGGSQPAITAPNANTLDIDLNAPRTVINWASLHVSGADEMDFHFDAASDIVLNKTTSQILIDAGGTVSGLVGASAGGNIWFYSPQGVIVSPGAVMTGGGFLFGRGPGINDVSFVDAADPLANLRAATDALIRITTISTATSASIDASGNVLLSASSGALNVGIAAGTTAGLSTTSGSIVVSEVTATSGAASVTAGGPGATVSSITGATGVTVSSGSNTSVGSATTTTSGDIVLGSGGSVSLTLGNSARDTLLTAPLIFLSTLDAGRDAILTGDTGVTVTNRIFAGDDIELTASNGDITAGGAFLRSTGLGAIDDAHILLRSDTGDVTATNTLQTQGTGVRAGNITIQAAATASAGTVSATRDVIVTGVTASLINGSAARDLFVTATTGGVTVTTAATAGDDVEVTATAGAVNANAATLKSTGVGASDDAHVLARSIGNTVNVGSAQTQGTGATVGDVTISAATTATLGAGSSSRDLTVSGVTASLTSGTATRGLFLTATTGGATVVTSATAGDVVEVRATSGDVSASGATLKSTGVGPAGQTSVVAVSTGGAVNVGSAITQGTGAAAGDITISAGTTATLDSGSSSRDLNFNGASASLTSGSAARDIVIIVHGVSGDATVVTSAIAGDDVEIRASSGDVVAGGATLRSTGVGASDDAHVLLLSSSGSVDFGTAITQGTGAFAGSVTVNAGGTITATSAQATLDVFATAAGDVDLGSATAGRDITVSSTGGAATLGAAVLTGSGTGHDLLVSASGDAILGAPDFSSITTANAFSRTGGNTGTATVSSTTGDAKVYLDASAAIDTLEGEGVDVTIGSGPMTFGTITANANNIYVEVLDGDLTVGTATAASGDVDLNAFNGALTLTGSAHGGGLVHLEAFGLLDGTSASLISSDGDLDLVGGVVDLGALQANGVITVSALDGNLDLQSALAGDVVQVGATGDAFVASAEAVNAAFVVAGGDALVNFIKVTDPAGFAIVHGDNNATVRAAEAPAGILVDAVNTATFGADDKASITAANYVVTDPTCGCGSGGLQVTSTDGDAVVNIDTASNGVAVVGSAIDGNVTIVQQAGDLKIEEVAGYNITIEAMGGTLETGATTSSGGDYTITAQDFLGDALTPFLFVGEIHDVTITDTLGDLNLGTLALHADRWLTIEAQDGAVTGAAQLSAGSGLNNGRVVVTGEGVALDTIMSDGLVTLDGGNGLVDVATSLDVWGNYTLRGGDFANAALGPQGSMLGTWNISDRIGGLDFSGKTLHYGGAVVLFVHGVVNGGDITVDTGNIYAEVDSGHLGTLTGPMFVGATSVDGGIDVDLIQAGTTARVWATDFGTARLGAAIMTGAGAPQVLVKAFDGDAILGAATPSAITAANVVTSTGATSTIDVTGATGRVDINLDHTTNAKLTTVSASNAVNIKVVNGSQAIGAVTSTNGAVTINGPTGALTVDQLTAHSTSRINAIGDMRLVAADADAQLTLQSLAGGLRLGDGTPGGVIDIAGGLTLQAFTDIVQEQGALKADTLTVVARSGVTLLGDNLIPNLLSVTVSNGGFAYHGTGAFILQDVVNVLNGTVDLRSDATIGQNLAGLILARKLTGSSVGAANFRAANEIVELGDFTNTTGLFRLDNNRALTIGGTVLSTGTLSIASHGGMTIAGTGTVRANGAGDAVVLASDGVFTNARGVDAVTAASAGGRWLIYTQAFGDAQGSTAGNTFNGLAGKSFYGAAYDFANSGFTVGLGGGDRFVYAYRPTLTVTPAGLIMTYDGTVPTLSATITGLVNGDLAADAWSGAPTISGGGGKNAGTYALTAAAGNLSSDLNYAFAFGTGTLRIDPRTLTVTADGAIKAFGQVDPTLSYRVTAGSLVAGDAFTGGLGREVGEVPGGYAITRGTLALSANYDVTFTGAVLTIRPLPSNETGGSPVLKHLNQSPDFTLDWDPESNLTTEGQPPSQASASGGGKVVAALR